jgi:hypothetical protein
MIKPREISQVALKQTMWLDICELQHALCISVLTITILEIVSNHNGRRCTSTLYFFPFVQPHTGQTRSSAGFNGQNKAIQDALVVGCSSCWLEILQRNFIHTAMSLGLTMSHENLFSWEKPGYEFIQLSTMRAMLQGNRDSLVGTGSASGR